MVLCFLLLLMGSSQIAATFHMGDRICLWIVCLLPHQVSAAVRWCRQVVSELKVGVHFVYSVTLKQLKPVFLFSLEEHLVYCHRLLSGILQWAVLLSTLSHYIKCNSTFFQNICFLQNSSKWCQFPPTSQNWKCYIVSQFFMAYCDKYWFWSFCVSCMVHWHIKKEWGFILVTSLF